ncbi:MAG: hypothetical protein WCV79_03265 [Candidatus Paceibacterota bacterium]|jgi:hypothetical protein
MSDVQFDEDSFGTPKPAAPVVHNSAPVFRQTAYAPVPGLSSSQPKMVQWLIRHHLAGSEKSANMEIATIIFINIAITVFLVVFFL